jgi:hypothetical protein
MVVAGEHRLDAVARNVSGVVLGAFVGDRALHARAVEELGVDRTGYERGDGDPSVLELVADRLGEESRKAWDAAYVAYQGPGMRLAIDAVTSTRPSRRSTMAGNSRFAV